MAHKLEADGIELSFGTRKILSDIYIKCETGKITGLLGRNGQGKTCLLHIIYGTLFAQSRSVRIDDSSCFEAFKRADLLTYLPQFNFIPSSLRLDRVFKDFELSFSAFELFFPEFKNKKEEKIRKLSGGQKRLVEVYLLIKSKSQFTILDEPFSHIMPLHIEQIQSLIIQEKTNKGFLITDHLFHSVIAMCDDLYILKDGKTHLSKDSSDLETLGYARI